MVELFAEWDPSSAGLLKTNVRESTHEPVDVEAAASAAKEQLEIEDSDGSGYLIPLFAKDEPVPTNEYVIYRPEYGHIGWHDSGFGIEGAERFTDADRLRDKIIGHRLRYWLPEKGIEPELNFDESKLPNETNQPSDNLSSEDLDGFFTELKEFVRSERETQRQANWERYTEVGLDQAIAQNQVSGPYLHISSAKGSDGKPEYNYQIVTEDDDDEINLRADEGIFQGNQCIVDAESENKHFPIEVEVTSVGDQQLSIQPVWNRISNRTAVKKILEGDTSEIWIHDLLNPVPFERRLDAIKQVEGNRDKRNLLTGNRPVEYSVNKYSLPETDIELNEYQRMALIWADSSEDIVCIHGPPGTGKTRTLTAYVKYAASEDNKILVTAHSNQAVDNLLVGDSSVDSLEGETLHAFAQSDESDLSIARVGNNSRNTVVQNNYVDQPIGSADIVAATTSGAAQFDANRFDVGVVDEATQASRPATAIALNSAQKLVLAGDHKQLPPYCADEAMQEEDMHISLFEYLLNRYESQISVLLQKQYRMNAEIAAFPNQAFYEGNLESAEVNRDWSVNDLKPLIGVAIDGSERQEEYGHSYYNVEEAEAVAKQVKLLVMNGVSPEDIGVIAAYRGQIGKIRTQIHRLEIDNLHAVSIDTVDSFQGSEREAVIVSFVRSNSDGNSGFLAFPDEGARRLNVAITRARKRLVLIANWETLGTVSPHRSVDESCAPLYADLAEQIRSKELMLEPSTQ